jgi:hypothetical protein
MWLREVACAFGDVALPRVTSMMTPLVSISAMLRSTRAVTV